MRAVARGLLTLVLAWGLLATPGAAAQLNGAGWWWRAQTGVLQPVPPPPYVPEDGLMVAGAPDGPSAVAAVRFVLAEGDTLPELTLQVENDRGGEAAQIVACPTREGWQSTQAGRWDGRPESNCDAAVDGIRSEDGDSWTFNLATLVTDGRINVVLKQAPPDEGPPSVFEITFGAPSADSLQTSPAGAGAAPPPAGGAPPPGRSQPPPEFAPADDSGFDGGGGFDAGGGDDFEAGEPMVADADFGDGQDGEGFGDEDEVAAPEVAGEEVADDEAAAPTGAGALAVDDGGFDVRTLAMMVALLCVAGFVMLSEDAGRRLVSAGTGGRLGGSPAPTAREPVVRGLGRFAKPREGNTPTLF